MPHLARLASLILVVTAAACWPTPPPEGPTEDPACGEAPASFDPEGPVVVAVSSAGCVRIERRTLEDGSVAPERLVAHVDGFSRRFDVDTDALTYETDPYGAAVIRSDDVSAQITMDPCTGEWVVDVNEGEAILPVVGGV